MTTTTKLQKAMLKNAVSGEVVFVEVNRDNRIVLTDSEGTSSTYSKRHTFNGVVKTFVGEGWLDVTEQHKVFKNVEAPLPEPPEIAVIEELEPVAPVELTVINNEENEEDKIRKMVDEFVDANKAASEAKKVADKIKKEIRAYMDKKGIKKLAGLKDMEVYLQTAKASNSTSDYTDYDTAMLQQVLPRELFEKISEVRVSAKLVKNLMEETTFSESEVQAIKKAEVYNLGSPKFTTRKIKDEA
ncbi:hypothetical protein KAMFAM_216 [Bacillus phage Kamfam]|nr:hypothetical protein OTK52_214 [Bacillus phage OTooleKemple52]AXQ67114.1 hypothetical protein KAMFAM_216 [Bacillus phage Kamfam]